MLSYLRGGSADRGAPGVTGTTTIGLIFVDGLTTLAGAPCWCDVTVLYSAFCFPVFADDEMVSAKTNVENDNSRIKISKKILCMITLSN